MTTSNQTARTGPYSGNGSTTVFAYDFRILDQTHIVVTLKNAANVETVQTLTTNYTVSGVGTSTGGNITMGVAPASGEQLTFSRAVPQTQEVDLANRGGVQPEILEAAYDKLTQLSQDKVELLNRMPRFPVSSALTDIELPLTLTANTALVVNAAGTGYTTGPTSSQISSAESDAAAAAASAVTAANEASAAMPKYTFSTTTTVADPGVGKLRLNHASPSSASVIIIDDQTADTGNPNVEDWLKGFDDSTSTIKGYVRLVEPGTPANYAVYNITGLTDSSGFIQLAVTHVDSQGTFGDTDSIRLSFARTGDKGDTGSTGSTGSTGPRADEPGLRLAFSTATADSDQGAGKIWLNNGTASSATVVYVDDVEAGGASINSLVDSWDDSTNTSLRGTITIKKNTAPENFHIFNVTGVVTSASTYSKVAVTHVLSAGTISNADSVSAQFVRTGNAGSLADPMTTRGDIIVRDSSNATARLAKGAANTVLTSDGTDPAYAQIATAMIADDAITLAKMASGTDGNLITYDASGNPAYVAAGSANQILTSQGAGSVPVFAAAPGGGKVLQIVTATSTAKDSSTSTSFADTSLACSITPTATTSKFWINVAVFVGGLRTNDSVYSGVTRFKETGVTDDVYPASTYGFGYGFTNDPSSFGHYIVTGSPMQWLHDPDISDTSALTYTCQHKVVAGTSYFNYGGTNTTAVITVTEIGA